MYLGSFKISSSNCLCRQSLLLILNSWRKAWTKTVIPRLVIKTSWHKLSTVLRHGGSSFYLQGSKKCSDWLSLSRKTHIPGGLTLTTCQSFLVQPALLCASMQAPLPYHPALTAKNQCSTEKTLFFFFYRLKKKDQKYKIEPNYWGFRDILWFCVNFLP